MIAFSFAGSNSKKRPKAASSFPIRPRKSRRRARSLLSAPRARNEAGQIQALDVKVGDRILFGKWSGIEIKINGEDLLIMKESDVMGIIEAQAEQRKAA